MRELAGRILDGNDAESCHAIDLANLIEKIFGGAPKDLSHVVLAKEDLDLIRYSLTVFMETGITQVKNTAGLLKAMGGVVGSSEPQEPPDPEETL